MSPIMVCSGLDRKIVSIWRLVNEGLSGKREVAIWPRFVVSLLIIFGSIRAWISNVKWVFWEVSWENTSTSKETIHEYQNYINSSYGECTVAFDGYLWTCSFNKRSRADKKNKKISIVPNMLLELENICIKVSQKVFWAALTTIKSLLSTITPL